MSFARNFAAGQQIAKTAMDTYETARERREFDRVTDATPEEIKGYSDDAASQLRGIAETKDAQGNYAYQLEAKPDGNYGLRVRGEDGNYTTVDGPGIQQRQTTSFLGKRYDGQLDEARMGGLRQNAYADVISRRDPIKGMQMRRQAKTDEQADARFGREQVQWDRQDQEYDEANRVKTGRREYVSKLSSMDPKDLAELVGDEFSKDGSGINAMLTWDPKEGKFYFASKIPGMPSRSLSRAELVNYAAGVWEAGNGDFEKGMRMQLDTIRSQRSLQEADRKDAATLASGNMEAGFKQQGLNVDNRRLDETRRHNMVSERNDGARLGLQSQQARLGRIEQVIDPTTGKVTFAELSMQGSQPTLRPVNMNGMGLAPKESGLKVNPDGSVVHGGKLYVPDDKNPGKYVEASGFGPSATDAALAAFVKNGGPDRASAPDNNFRPLPRQDITQRSAPGYGNPENFERRSTRSMFGGQPSYYYHDPATGRNLSVQEYNKLVGSN